MENVNFIAIDFETATSDRSSICEIGLTIVKNGIITDSKSWLVQPPHNDYDPFNSEIHGITARDTKNSPLFPDIWKEVLPILHNQIIVAHNTGFDMYALRDVLLLYNIPYPDLYYYCSYRISKYIFKDSRSYSLPVICKHIGVDLNNHHRAKDDSMACAELFLKCLMQINCSDIHSLQDIYKFKRGEFSESSFKPQLSIASRTKTPASKIVGDPDKFEVGSIFYGKNVCFTGTCTYGVRDELLQKIADIGGFPMSSVNKKTDVLIVGQQDFRVVGESGMSSKQKKAFELKANGSEIEILSEAEFLSNI